MTSSSSGSLTATYGRIRRRELHSSRSAAAITVAVVVILLCLWLAAEIVLRLIDQPALLAAPVDLADGVASASTAPAPLLAGIATAGALLGQYIVQSTLGPARRIQRRFVGPLMGVQVRLSRQQDETI